MTRLKLSLGVIKLGFGMSKGTREMIEERNLDGIYYRVIRGGKVYNLCLTDLTKEEREKILKEKSAEYLLDVCQHLAERLRTIGDKFDIVSKG